MVATPSLIRDVRAATNPSATIGSSTLRYTGSMLERDNPRIATSG